MTDTRYQTPSTISLIIVQLRLYVNGKPVGDPSPRVLMIWIIL